MKGTYTTKSGDKVEVLNFDAENNIAYVDFGGEKRWVGQCDYIDWASDSVEVAATETVSTEPKKTRKKKDAAN